MKKINIDGLLALNPEEIEIVYRRCRGDSVKKAALEMAIPESTVWNQKIPRICQILGVDTWREIEEELCIPLRRIIPSLQVLKQGWPEAFREKIEALRPDKAPLEEPVKPSGSSSSIPSTVSSVQSQSTLEGNQGVPSRPRIAWPLIAIPLILLGLLCIAGIIFGGSALGDFLRPEATSPPTAQTSVPVIDDTSTPESSPTVQLSDTAIPLPSETLTPTSTLAPTSTLTLLPTITKSPIGLVKGDELQDNRVTLKLTDIQYNQKYDRIGAKVAPISFFFDFTNHSGGTIVLQFDSSDFQSVDNTGYEADCWFYHISGAGEKVNEPLNNGDTREIVARCGLGNLNPNVTTVTLTVHPFTSLPESTWIAEIPH